MQRVHAFILLAVCHSLAEGGGSIFERQEPELNDVEVAGGGGGGGGRRCYKGLAVKRSPAVGGRGEFLKGYKVPGGREGGTQDDLPPDAPVLTGMHRQMMRRGSRMFYSPLEAGEKLVLKCCGPRGFNREDGSCIEDSETSGHMDFKFCRFFITIASCGPCTTSENDELGNLLEDADHLVMPYSKHCAPRLQHHGDQESPMQIFQVIVPAGDQVRIGPVGDGKSFHNIIVIGRQYNWIHKLEKILPSFIQDEEELEDGDPENAFDFADTTPHCWLPQFLEDLQPPLEESEHAFLCLVWWIVNKLLTRLVSWCKLYVGPSRPRVPSLLGAPSSGERCFCPVYDN